MNCDEVRRFLITEGGVGYESRPLARHLSGCGCCREEIARLEAEERVLRAAFLALEVASDFTEGVLLRIG